MYLLPGDKKIKPKPSHRYPAFDYMRNSKLVGVGWQTEKVDTLQDAILALRRLTTRKEPIRFIEEVQVGDLVWVHDGRIKQYYLCKILSGARQLAYIHSNMLESDLDVAWVRDAEWRQVNPELVSVMSATIVPVIVSKAGEICPSSENSPFSDESDAENV